MKANGAIYDVAVNVGSTGGVDDVHTTTREKALPAWSEGWHPGVLEDYVSLGLHSADLTLETRDQLAAELTADLATREPHQHFWDRLRPRRCAPDPSQRSGARWPDRYKSIVDAGSRADVLVHQPGVLI